MTQEKVQILVELLKQGDGARAAATDLKAVEAQAATVARQMEALKAAMQSQAAAQTAVAGLRGVQNQAGSTAREINNLQASLQKQPAAAQTTANALKGVETQAAASARSAAQLRGALQAQADGAQAAARQTDALKNALVSQGDGARTAANELKRVETQAASTNRQADSLRQTLRNLFVGVSAGIAAREITQATLSAERMGNTLRAVNGSSEAAAREFAFVRGEADQLGLELETTVGAYTRLSAAAKGTSLAGEGVKEIFLGVSEAGTVLGLSAAEQAGALNAIQQMMSKGTVMAEELRGQLGERLPGAFQIAARAMGVTTQELGKMLELGQVTSAEFLPRFAAELRRTFGEDAVRASHSLNAELNRLRTAFFELKAAIGGDGSAIFGGLVRGATAGLEVLKEHRAILESLTLAVGILAAEMAAARVLMGISAAAFGAGWLKSSADIVAATALVRSNFTGIATAAATMSQTVMASFAGITAGVWILVEALRALKAESEEVQSRDNLLAQTEARKKAIEQQIELRATTGEISRERAGQLKQELDAAFQKEIVTTKRPLATGMSPAMPAEVTIREPDIEARRAALRAVSVTLEPDMQSKPVSPGPIESAGKPVIGSNEQLIQNVEDLRRIQERMYQESLQGLEKEEARINTNYEARGRQIEQLREKMSLGTEEVNNLRNLNLAVRDNELAEVRLREEQKRASEARRQEAELARQASEEMQRLEQQLTTAAVNSSETRVQQANREYQARVELLDRLYREGKLNEDKFNQLSLEASARRIQTLASAAEAGRLEAQRLSAITAGEDVDRIAIDAQFAQRREALEAYYEFELAQAEGNALRIIALEEKKAAHMHQLAFQQRVAQSQIAQGMIQVGQAAQQQFAGGMSRAFMSIMDGSKSAKEAFRDFATMFLRMVVEMIMQTLILIALRMALKSIPGIGALLGGGGQVAAGSGGTMMSGQSHGSVANFAAAGGWFNALGAPLQRPAILAAAGVMMGASGVDGVASVDRATYFPKFNVIAGEAGREVLTVMAKPQTVEVNGVRAVIGNVGPKQVAMLSARDFLRSESRTGDLPRMMAEGGVAGTMDAQPSMVRMGGAAVGGLNGNASIEVVLSKDLEARIVREAIQGATLRVRQEIQHDSPTSHAIRRLVQ